MKILYYNTCSYGTPHIGVIINSIQNNLKAGHDVYFAYCDKAQHTCFKNRNSNESNCRFCRITYRNIVFNQIAGAFIIPISIRKTVLPSYEYNDIETLRAIKYKGVCVGMSILSTYFTATRNIDFEITPKLKKYFDYLIEDNIAFIDQIEKLINDISPECIIIYNGREFENRAFYDFAINKNIKFESLDVVGGIGEPYKPRKFLNGLPHNITFFAENAKRVWNVSTDVDKINIATSFYEKRRNGIACCDKSYTDMQVIGKLPQIVPGKKNIVVFNSSSDELAAIGGEWDENLLFKTQYQALQYILSNLSENYHLYLRIHPNLNGINQKHHLDLYKLADEFNNITIINPSDSISSYALLDIADKVIVFGSTMGVEACYWEKPVILVGHAFYELLDVAYIPQNTEDLLFLLSSDIKAKNNIGSLIYSYYLLDRKYSIDKINENNDFEVYHHKILGKKFDTFSFLRICNSTILYSFVEFIYRKVFSKLYKDKNRFTAPL